MKKPDKYGWFRQQEYCGSSRKGHYNFLERQKIQMSQFGLINQKQ